MTSHNICALLRQQICDRKLELNYFIKIINTHCLWQWWDPVQIDTMYNYMAVLCGMPTIQYSARRAWLSVHKMFTSCIRRGLVSPDAIVDACDWVMSALSAMRYQPCCIGCRWKYGEFSCMECTCQGNDFELIPMVEMETRNPVEGYFGSEFQNSVRDTNFVKYGRHEISEIVHCFPDKKKNKISSGSPAVTTARIVPKICQGQLPPMYSECSRFHPNLFTFGVVIAERVNTAKTWRILNPIFDWSLALSQIIKQLVIFLEHGINQTDWQRFSSQY